MKYKLSENITVQAEIQPTKLFEQDYLFAAGNKEEKRQTLGKIKEYIAFTRVAPLLLEPSVYSITQPLA